MTRAAHDDGEGGGVSKMAAVQRRGRAGRCGPGCVCRHLISNPPPMTLATCCCSKSEAEKVKKGERFYLPNPEAIAFSLSQMKLDSTGDRPLTSEEARSFDYVHISSDFFPAKTYETRRWIADILYDLRDLIAEASEKCFRQCSAKYFPNELVKAVSYSISLTAQNYNTSEGLLTGDSHESIPTKISLFERHNISTLHVHSEEGSDSESDTEMEVCSISSLET